MRAREKVSMNQRTGKVRRLLGLLLLATSMFLLACSSEAPQGTQQEVSTTSPKQTEAPPPPPPPKPQPAAASHISLASTSDSLAKIPIYYATDRAVFSANAITFGPQRGQAVSYGRVVVSVPRDHRFLNIERPSWFPTNRKETIAKHFVIINREAFATENDFFQYLRSALQGATRQDILLFIHGFNVSFDDAAYRTAQLTYDLGFNGTAMMYSWPSNGKILQYVSDSNNNEWTVTHLRQFLADLAQNSHATRIHIIAHSMGNRALVHAFDGLQLPASQQHLFGQIMLTAPDIDAGTFKNLAAAMKAGADRVTLYASSSDEALKASEKLQGGYQRAGDAAPTPVVVDGIDTVDVSAVSTNFWKSPIGHFYYGDNDSVVSDMYYLLDGKAPPRYRLRHPAQPADAAWWQFQR